MRGLPGVQSTGIATVPPLTGHFVDTTFEIEGRPPLRQGQFLDAVVRAADPDYFKAVGIALKRGRTFTPAEWLDAADKCVMTESMAKTFFPDEDPIGKRLHVVGDRYEIVGVVADTRQNLALAPEPMMYFPLFSGSFEFASLMVRTSGDPNLFSLPAQKTMRTLDPDPPAVTVSTVDEMMWGATQQNRLL
jgi:hypothetical protein